MPAKSKKQQKMMGMGLAMKRGKMPMKGRAGMMAKHIMSEKEMEEYASTKFSDLPMKKKSTKSKAKKKKK